MKKILIADDEPHLRLLIATTLGSDTYELLEAEDGKEVVARVLEDPPDLVILDWMMPNMSGIEVLEALSDGPLVATIPVIMLTAKTQKTDRKRAAALGIHRFLPKPFSPLELLELVEKVLAEAEP